MTTDPTPDRLPETILGGLARRGVDAMVGHRIGLLTTYRVGGPSACHVIAHSVEDLLAVADVRRSVDVPLLVIGKGSNLLIADDGFAGISVQLGDEFSHVQVEVEGCRLVAGGAASLPVAARQSVAAGLTGFEWAVGVPGTVGGAVRMNAGGHGSDVATTVVGVRVVDLERGKDVYMTNAECGFGYRRSVIGAGQVVVGAEFALSADDEGTGGAEVRDVVSWRREHQPGGQNAGSVFTNPPGDSAGRLIDAAGCKGLRRGSAEVSSKHANFIQADADGTAADVAALMATVRSRVLEYSGVALEAETVMIGFDEATVDAAGGRR